MRGLIICLALLGNSMAFAEDETGIDFDARTFAVSFGSGRVLWRLEALDVLPLPVHERFGGVELGEEEILAQDLASLPFEPEDEPRCFLSFTIGW